MRISKYQPLTDFLLNCGQISIRLTFSQIEEIIGSELPSSAHVHSVWWVNSNQTTCVHWLKAGYIITQYSLDNQYAVFQKNDKEANYYLSKMPAQSTNQSHKTHRDQLTPHIIREPVISCEELIAASQKYTNEIRQDAHARYLSWEHCYSYFQSHRQNPSDEELDFMCLHLAWYLASWGMLRGGAFLLWKDYKVHLPVVKLLLSEEYSDLNNCTPESLANESTVEKILNLADHIVSIYWDITEETGEGKRASDTLVTKILLGTLGCTPAYDRYFKSGLSITGVAHQRFGKRSLLELACYYIQHKEEMEIFRKKISENRVEYTPMKVIDMCFWQVGFDADPVHEDE